MTGYIRSGDPKVVEFLRYLGVKTDGLIDATIRIRRGSIVTVDTESFCVFRPGIPVSVSQGDRVQEQRGDAPSEARH